MDDSAYQLPEHPVRVFVLGSPDHVEAFRRLLGGEPTESREKVEMPVVIQDPWEADVALIVVPVDEGVTERLSESLRLLAWAGVPSVVVFLDKVELVLKKEAFVLKLIEFEVRDLLATLGFSAKLVPFVRGSVAGEAKGVASEWRLPTRELLSALKRQPPRPKEGTSEPFRMPIHEAFKTDEGVQVVGTIEHGSVRAGETIEIVGPEGFRTMLVHSVESPARLVEEGRRGAQYRLLLQGADWADSVKWRVASSPGLYIPTGASADYVIGTGIAIGQGAEGQLGNHFVLPRKETEYLVVPVFYATDRELKDKPLPESFYGSRRGDGSLSFGLVEVSIPPEKKRNLGELPRPGLWRFLFPANPAKHVLLLNLKTLDQETFLATLRGTLEVSTLREALVFVHGFNVTFEEAARRTAQLAVDLDFKGVPILYSWPSEGKVHRYAVDEGNVEWSQPHFEKFLHMVLTETDAQVVHVIAHSMGARLLAYTLPSMDAQPGKTLAALRQIVFAAPDIDRDTFVALAEKFHGQAERLTLYGSSNDRAIQASKVVHRYPRAGGSGKEIALANGIDSIDSSAADTSLLGHSYFGDRRSILSDLFSLLRHAHPPDQRYGLASRNRANFRYWVYKP